MGTQEFRQEVEGYFKRHAAGWAGRDRLLSWIDGARTDLPIREGRLPREANHR